ncbi:MAG: muconolactone Delta-isomerase family protein [Saprospiraceae bacterium]
MRKAFMIEFDLPALFTEEFMALIPKQRYVINELMDRGDIRSYSLALDRSKLWMIAVAKSEFELMEMIEQLPLSMYMSPAISELMFHNTASMVLQFSLN